MIIWMKNQSKVRYQTFQLRYVPHLVAQVRYGDPVREKWLDAAMVARVLRVRPQVETADYFSLQGGVTYDEALKRAMEASKQAAPSTPRPPPEPKECSICLSAPRSCALDPCSHAVTCEDCAQLLLDRGMPCPICRQPINAIVPGDFGKSYVGRPRLLRAISANEKLYEI